VGIRNQNRITKCTVARALVRRGAATVQLLVILVPVLFGLIGFAIDLGQLYLAKGELKAAANSMALAAAQKLIGTDQALTDANEAARLTLDNSTGFGNKYHFGSLVIGQGNGSLASDAPDPAYFTALQDALAAEGAGPGGGANSRHALVTLNGQVLLTFWGFLPLATDRRVTVAARAVAGISAPLCTACSMEAFTVAAIDQTDTVNFGFVQDNKYTMVYNCNGNPTPTILPGSSVLIRYLILNRLDTNATIFTNENSQLFRMGAQGMPGSSNTALSCFSINATEQVWASATPLACSATPAVPQVVQAALCGLTTRFEASAPAICAGVPEIDTLTSIYTPDPDTSDIDTYESYAGNGRRIITVSIVDTLNPNSMNVLGFRQFLVEPNLNAIDLAPADVNGRFRALYIGSVAPIKQGRFDGCQNSSGPGKVVIHQ
jgi:Flp pilus assembly protein TadG